MGLAFIYLALATCLVVYAQKSDFHLINVFCVVIVVKNLGYLILYCIAARYLWCLPPKLHICTTCPKQKCAVSGL